MNKTACFNCTERTLGCHSTCQKYADYRLVIDKIAAKKEELYQQNNSNYFVTRTLRIKRELGLR